ncbi:hypothetical protein G6L37_07310 [Agrobacterium rubi]|nr:hypothetical protein [Agrobacterium rubi]NTF25175.1 hypothetical protein [Agrobacterium rubi]
MTAERNQTRDTKIAVRQLQWVETRDDVYEIGAHAMTSIGRYEVWYFRLKTDTPKDCYGWQGPLTKDAEVESYEAAKAAAQADYERRIMAAIEPQDDAAGLPDVRQWQHYPIEMPLTDEGEGPATVGFDATKITYEVWDQALKSHGSYDHLPDAINESIRLNAVTGQGGSQDAQVSI